MYELMVEDTFHAAHALRGYQGPCENLHGHSWKVQLFLKGEKLNKIGLLIDFKEVKSILKEVIAPFDHQLINDIKPFDAENPSSENLAKTIYKEMKKRIKETSKIIIWESATARAAYWE
jgi:6-pyruvoyltetrahydropterin/6-carboxytetrahydropterin synthase